MRSAELTDLRVAGSNLVVQFINDREARSHGAGPGLGQLQRFEKLSAGHTEEIGDRTWVAEIHQHRVNAALECGSVDLVGLAGQRREPLDLLSIGDVDLPAGELELIVDEASAGHRLDGGADRFSIPIQPHHHSVQPVSIRRNAGDGECAALAVQDVDVQALPDEIQSNVQHMGPGLLYDLGALTPHSFVYRRPFFIPFGYCSDWSSWWARWWSQGDRIRTGL